MKVKSHLAFFTFFFLFAVGKSAFVSYETHSRAIFNSGSASTSLSFNFKAGDIITVKSDLKSMDDGTTANI